MAAVSAPGSQTDQGEIKGDADQAGRTAVVAGAFLLVSCGLCVWSLTAIWITTATPSFGLPGYYGTANGMDLLRASHRALAAMDVGRFASADIAAWIVVVVASITGVWGLRCVLDRIAAVGRGAISACYVAAVLIGAAFALATPSNFPPSCGPDVVCRNGQALEIVSRSAGQWIAVAAGAAALVGAIVLAGPRRWRHSRLSEEAGSSDSAQGAGRTALPLRLWLRLQLTLLTILVLTAGLLSAFSSSSGTINVRATELNICRSAQQFVATMAPNPYQHAYLMDRMDQSASLIPNSSIGAGALEVVAFFRRHHTGTFLFDLLGPIANCQDIGALNPHNDTLQWADAPNFNGWGMFFYGDSSLDQAIRACGNYLEQIVGYVTEPYPPPRVATSLKRHFLAARSALDDSSDPFILNNQYKQACLALHLPPS